MGDNNYNNTGGGIPFGSSRNTPGENDRDSESMITDALSGVNEQDTSPTDGSSRTDGTDGESAVSTGAYGAAMQQSTADNADGENSFGGAYGSGASGAVPQQNASSEKPVGVPLSGGAYGTDTPLGGAYGSGTSYGSEANKPGSSFSFTGGQPTDKTDKNETARQSAVGGAPGYSYGGGSASSYNGAPYGGAETPPYPGMNAAKSKNRKEKKPPTRKTLVVFGAITLVLCLLMSTASGALSSYITVRLIEAHDKYGSTTTPYKDELISVPTEKPEPEQNDETAQGTVTKAPTEKPEKVTSASSGQKTKGEVYAESVNAIVGIKAEGTKEVTTIFGRTAQAPFTSTGSGFFVTESGYIVTNYHVIENATKVTVTTYAGQAYEAKITGYEASNDIAVLKAEGSFESVKIGDSSSLAVGDDILVIGNALGELSYTFTDGVVSYLNRAITTDSGTVINMYQTNAAINEGNSGGPVYDMEGKVVGIASAKYAASSVEGLGFFIPLNDVKGMINDIIEKGYVSGKPSLGISVQPLTQTMSLRYSLPVGLYVVAVGTDTAASKAGIKAADVITGLDGEAVSGVAELSSALSSKRAGETITLTLYRSGSSRSVTLTLDEYKPSSPRTEYSGVYDY